MLTTYFLILISKKYTDRKYYNNKFKHLILKETEKPIANKGNRQVVTNPYIYAPPNTYMPYIASSISTHTKQ